MKKGEGHMYLNRNKISSMFKLDEKLYSIQIAEMTTNVDDLNFCKFHRKGPLYKVYASVKSMCM